MSFSDDIKKEEEMARRRFVHATRPRGPLSMEQAEALARRMEGSTESRTKSQYAGGKAVADFARACKQQGLDLDYESDKP